LAQATVRYFTYTSPSMPPSMALAGKRHADKSDDLDASAGILIKRARLEGKTFTPEEVEELVQNEVRRVMAMHALAPTPQLLQETFTPHDPVHGLIHLPLIVKAVVDTRVFQRMRYIRQLGMCDRVYPGATHNRFFHSIGTAYLAYELVKGLKHRQPELRVTDRDVLCATLAGLCHDLGHPCFSHMFETFVHTLGRDKRLKAEREAVASGQSVSLEALKEIQRYENWSHEDASVRLLEIVLEEVRGRLESAGLQVDSDGDDFACIRELIDPPKRQLEDALFRGELRTEWSTLIKGRPVEKAWLYEVISNWRSGIDVDKFDYFRRDALYLGIHKEFDHFRYLKAVCVLPDNTGVPTISPPDKERDSLRENMLELRKSLHRTAYQHKTVKKLEMHMIDILKMMDPHTQITGTGGKKFRMSEAAVQLDPAAYQKLTDAFVETKLLEDEEPALHPAALEYNHRIMRRQMMRLVADWDVERGMAEATPLASEDIIDGVVENYPIYAATVKPGEPVLDVPRHELRCEVCTFHYGMRAKDPISRVLFHSSKDSTLKSHLSDSDAKPMKQKVFVFWNPSRIEKDNPQHRLTCSRLTRAFEKWAMKKASTGVSPAEMLSPSRIARVVDPMDDLLDAPVAPKPEAAKVVEPSDNANAAPTTPKPKPAPAAPPKRKRTLSIQASCPPDMM